MRNNLLYGNDIIYGVYSFCSEAARLFRNCFEIQHHYDSSTHAREPSPPRGRKTKLMVNHNSLSIRPIPPFVRFGGVHILGEPDERARLLLTQSKGLFKGTVLCFSKVSEQTTSFLLEIFDKCKGIYLKENASPLLLHPSVGGG